MTHRQRTLTAWGRSSRTNSRVWEAAAPERAQEALAAAGPRGVIARGLGRSYGDACLNDGGDVIDTRPGAAIRSIDAERGLVACDAGVAYRELMPRLLPLGWLPPVCPGTAFVTMGGAVANDVHGKNQHVAGSFGEHIEWIDLLTPGQGLLRVTPEGDRDLFAATVGGIGLTGVVTGIGLRLQRVPSNAFELRELRAGGLDEVVALLAEHTAMWPYAVAWIDALAGAARGRGVLELARPAAESLRVGPQRSVPVPVDLPEWVLQPAAMRAFNALYFHRIPRSGRTRRVEANRFLYPLDALLEWNRLYGRSGVYQFQCVVPEGDAARSLTGILSEAARLGGNSFLAVVKRVGRAGVGHLSFATPGYSMALDFPRRPATRAVVERLQEVALAHGGRVYLAKDARLRPGEVERMYPALDRFLAVLDRVDPEGVMQSDMSRRLGLRGDGARR